MTPIEEIKSRIGILDVVSNYVRVEKSGNQYKARCPFHNEKTPSFYISPTRNTYHCFGCGVGGDIFKFIESIEHIEFKEALKILAERAGVTLDYRKENIDKTGLDILREASLFFEINLKESIEAKKYLHDRGLLDETISEYQIGFAKNDWRTLFVYLSSKGYSPEDIVESGLVIKTDDNKYYDRFRGRIMFPIRNISGAIVGFTGRVLPAYDDGKSGKYVNTPETKLYHKSKVLFNYDKAKKYIAENREVVLAEGQMDVIMSHQAEVKNIVAVSGTAFTEEQVKMISRLADSVVLAFDNDSAGQKAADRAVIMCAYGGLRIYTVQLDEKDIADITLHDKNNWLKILKNKKPIIESYADKINKMQGADKVVFIKNQVAPYLRALQSPIERDFNISDFARLTSINPDSIREELKKNITVEELNNLDNKNNTEAQNNKDKKEDISLELYILSKELRVKENVELPFYTLEVPEEIYNKKVLELESKDALNIRYYEETIRTYTTNLINDIYKKIKESSEIDEEQKILKISEINNIKNQYNKSDNKRLSAESMKVLTNQLVNN